MLSFCFTNDFVETQINDNEFMNNNNVDFLDRRISIEEINISISSLKNGKSGSVDSLIPQLFKVCHNQLDLCYVNCLISYFIIKFKVQSLLAKSAENMLLAINKHK